MSDTKRRIALITGGTGGIGSAICRRMLHEGYQVVTNYRSEEKARQWQQELAVGGLEVGIIAADVSDFDSCQNLIEQIEGQHGPIDILVNNAGITRDTTLKKMSHEQWESVINTNLNSVFNLTRPIINGMLERGFGRIINISSINGQKGQLGQTNYSAAKAGMHGFTMALAQEVAFKGITVNTISPGYIATEMVMAVPEAIREKIIAQIPVGRLGRPEEIAAAVVYLASDEAGFMTGADLSINGGQYMH
jgi:acetoacetyl-CoA reductase